MGRGRRVERRRGEKGGGGGRRGEERERRREWGRGRAFDDCNVCGCKQGSIGVR